MLIPGVRTRPRTVAALCVIALFAAGCELLEDKGRGRSRIMVMDGLTGEPLWVREFPSEGISIDPFAPEDEIAVFTFDRCTTDDPFRAFDARTGHEHDPPPFEGYPLPEALRGHEACELQQTSGERIGNADGACLYRHPDRLVALEGESGAERFSLPLQPNETVVLLDAELFRLTRNGTGLASGVDEVARLSLDTGTVIWSVPVDDRTPRVLGDDVVYLGDGGPEVVALALDDGEELWRDDLDCEGLYGTHDLLVCVQQIHMGMCTYEAD
jgi:outer membrane protein assembly factor BamB